MLHLSLEVHPIYGAIPHDGDVVQPGDVLGLSTDSREVVVAPIGGRIRLISAHNGDDRRLLVEILQESDSGPSHGSEAHADIQ